mgnify:CR=1 FL=1|jgi:hypothetical protein
MMITRMMMSVLVAGILSVSDLRAQQVPVQMSLPDTLAKAGDVLRVPVLVSDLTGLEVSSSDLLIHYDARVVVAQDIRLTGTMTNRWTQAHRIDLVEGSQDTLGLIDIAVATANRIPAGEGTFLEIEFEVLEDALPGSSTTLELIQAILNSRDPATIAVGGSITVDGFTGLLGDFNGDCVVNFFDFILFVPQFGTEEGDPGWDPLFDLNDDGRVNFGDFLIFVRQWGKRCD